MSTRTAAVRAVLPAVVVDYVLTHLGYFVVMPILPLLLAASFAGEPITWTGIALGAMSFAMRGGTLFVSGWMHRASVRAAVVAGLLLVALGFTITGITSNPWLVTAALTIAGLGFSVNGIATRGYVALRVDDSAGQNTVFGIIQVVVNLAAAIGPVIANLLLGQGAYQLALLGSAGLFLLTALIVPATIPAGSHLAEGSTRPPLKLGLLRDIVVDPALRRISLVVLVGGFLYGQFFSSLAVMVNRATEEPLLRAGFYTLNAVIVVAAQLPATRLVNRALAGRARTLDVLVAGIVVFGLSFALVAAGGAGLVAAYAGIVLFSIGETIYTPTVNTAFIEAARGRPVVEAFNLRQIASATGESLGALAGGWLYLVAVSASRESAYWGGLAALALLPVVTSWLPVRGRRG
jgi:MFS family permease